MSDTDNIPTCLIEVCTDGPLLVQGDADLDGTRLEPGTALCRCGHSANKPFCDGSHKTNAFADPGRVAADGITGTASDAAALKIKLAPNGPILCAGPLTVRSSDGAQSAVGARAALCRCGQSSNKPFCDGTHGKVGFDAS